MLSEEFGQGIVVVAGFDMEYFDMDSVVFVFSTVGLVVAAVVQFVELVEETQIEYFLSSSLKVKYYMNHLVMKYLINSLT